MGPISIFDGLQDTAVTSKTKAKLPPVQQKPRFSESEGGPSCPVIQKYQSWKETGGVSPWKFPDNQQKINGTGEKRVPLRDGKVRSLKLWPVWCCQICCPMAW